MSIVGLRPDPQLIVIISAAWACQRPFCTSQTVAELDVFATAPYWRTLSRSRTALLITVLAETLLSGGLC